jgi:hypothetical protein
MKKNLFKSAWEWFKRLFSGKQKLTPDILNQDVFVKTKRIGRGAYFKNNRRRTRGRNIQYIPMKNGSTRIIRHEVA